MFDSSWYFLFSQAVFSFIELVIYKCYAMPELVIARVMIKNKTAKIAYYHGTIQ